MRNRGEPGLQTEADSTEEKENTRKTRRNNIIKGAIGLVLSLGVMALCFVFRNEIKNLSYLGYLGLFIACFAANATIFLPAPSSAIVAGFAAALPPLWVGVVGGVGAALGEMVGFYAGKSGRIIAKGNKYTAWVEKLFKKNAVITVFVFSFLPVPLFDVIAISAGVAKMGTIRFSAACLIGKILKMIVYAFVAGAIYVFILNLIHSLNIQFINDILDKMYTPG